MNTTELPLEMWRHIFEQVPDAADLAIASRLCKFVQLEAEYVLYRYVEIHSSTQAQRLGDTLKLCPRRVGIIHGAHIDISKGELRPDNPTTLTPSIEDDAVQCINTLLKMVPHLRTLKITVGLARILPNRLHMMLEGTTANILSLSFDFSISSDFARIIEQRPAIEKLSIFPRSITTPCAFPDCLLPNLRYLRCSSFILDMLQGPHHITHLTLHYRDPRHVNHALDLLGHQLVSLSLCRAWNMFSPLPDLNQPSRTLPFTKIQSVELPCLTRLATRTALYPSGSKTNRSSTSEVPILAPVFITVGDILQDQTLDVGNFYPPLGPIRTWTWCIGIATIIDSNEQQVEISTEDIYRESMSEFAAKLLFEMWPSLEYFEYIRLGERSSVVYSRGEDGKLTEREKWYGYPLMWDLY